MRDSKAVLKTENNFKRTWGLTVSISVEEIGKEVLACTWFISFPSRTKAHNLVKEVRREKGARLTAPFSVKVNQKSLFLTSTWVRVRSLIWTEIAYLCQPLSQDFHCSIHCHTIPLRQVIVITLFFGYKKDMETGIGLFLSCSRSWSSHQGKPSSENFYSWKKGIMIRF